MPKKPTIIRAWPELCGYNPAIIALPKHDEESTELIELDFSSVRSLDSAGLTSFILQVLCYTKSRSYTLTIREEMPSAVKSQLMRLNALKAFQIAATKIQKNFHLPDDGPDLFSVSVPLLSTPIYHFQFHGDQRERRRLFDPFKKWLIDWLENNLSNYRFKTNIFLMLLSEVIKNAADHAEADAFFGMDVRMVQGELPMLTFTFGDLGAGIMETIKSTHKNLTLARRKKLSIDEAYRLALTNGVTGKPGNGINMGHGMSMILQCAASLHLNLSVFDGESRGLLSNIKDLDRLSHSAMRREFHPVRHPLCFQYYGEMQLSLK